MTASETRYVDRATGKVEVERVFGGNALNVLYGTRRGRLLVELALKHGWANRLYGALQRSARTKAKIASFVAALGIDVSEAERALDDYACLDDFFARKLKPDARPIDRTPAHLVSPADSRLLVWNVLAGTRLPVKGAAVTLEQLAGPIATGWGHGAALVARLAPADYHRFHFPDGGAAGASRTIAGALHSVHPIALAAGAPSFLNKRSVSVLESDGFGPLLLVEVGALCVGTIEQTYVPGRVERGQEKGVFHFGGSTVVLVAQHGRVKWDADLVRNSDDGLETLVRMGTRIGVSASP